MKRLQIILLLLVSLQVSAETQKNLDGKELALSYCTQCHGLPPLKKYDAAGWELTIERMRGIIENMKTNKELKSPSDAEVQAINQFIASKLN